MMDFKSYISGINFSFIQPFDSGVGLFTNLMIPSTVDIRNTNLPYDDKETKETLAEVCKVPRMSTFAIGAIINLIVKNMPQDTAFVNVGVWHGFSFLCGLVNNPGKKCVGIDNFSEFGGPREAFLARFKNYKSGNHEFHDMDYLEYFTQVHKGMIGFYIYDGNHSRENQYRGLKAAEPFFSENCLILIDDINWPEPEEGTNDFIAGSRYKYNVIAQQCTSHNCHPTFWNGIKLLQRAG
ncbi:MAG: class I SAM-dependent methyltransferase [Spirochaetes bacterium]|nr:class I SAM-dependent methyltransferase [Spirochaetota bacterium]